VVKFGINILYTPTKRDIMLVLYKSSVSTKVIRVTIEIYVNVNTCKEHGLNCSFVLNNALNLITYKVIEHHLSLGTIQKE
jgi:hypothetical protein